MRCCYLAVFAVLAPSPLLAATFDLSLDDLNGERVVVVARTEGGAFAAAAGGEDLKVLKGEDADRARASLVSMDEDDREDLPAESDDGKKKEKKKIVIHKMSIDEDERGAGDEEKSVVRVIKKKDVERREETLLDDEAEALLKAEGDSESAVERRVIRLKGADAARAIKFIDETAGLDDSEKAEMKAALGL